MPLGGYIKSIDSFGLMTIQLNQSIYYKELILSNINKTNTVIELTTRDKRD